MPFTHKIPQNVTQYESRIVGNFTPRQFIYLAIGGAIIMLSFMLPLPGLIRIIILIVVAPISLLFALASFDGRRTDVWLLNTIQAVFKPTQRVWQKDTVPPEFLLPSYIVPKKRVKNLPKKSGDLEQFLDFWRTQEAQKDYSEEEVEFLERISKLTKAINAPTTEYVSGSQQQKPVKVIPEIAEEKTDLTNE